MGIIERFRDSIPAYRQAQFSKIVDQPNNPAQQSPPPADTFAALLRRIPCKGTPICSIRDATPCPRLAVPECGGRMLADGIRCV